MSCLRYLCLLAYCGVQHVLTIRGTWRVFNKRQKLLTLHEFIHGVLVFYGANLCYKICNNICMLYSFLILYQLSKIYKSL
jgi:hypothetical protein